MLRVLATHSSRRGLFVACRRVAPLLKQADISFGAVPSWSVRHKHEWTEEKRQEALKRSNALQRDWNSATITYAELKPKTEAPSMDEYLIDVREPDEVLQGSIPSAVNLPLSVFPSVFKLDPETFANKFGFPKPSLHQEITFYCRSGKRSASASDIARRNGYEKVINYEGSWLDWVAQEGKK